MAVVLCESYAKETRKRMQKMTKMVPPTLERESTALCYLRT